MQRADYIDLTPWKEQIISWVDAGIDQTSIIQLLQQESHIKIGRAKLTSSLRDWSVKSKARRYEDTPELRSEIAYAFHHLRLKDHECVAWLEHKGFTVGKRRIGRLRRELKLFQRLPKELDDETHCEYMAKELRKELQDGKVGKKGREALYQYMRTKYNVVGRDRLHRVNGMLNPEAIQRRHYKVKEHKGCYVVPGPDYAWSIDAHCKLEHWGIQIYAAIDTYSRYVLWCYVGITARTQVSVLAQYTATLRHGGILPQILRSDRGAETVMAADFHYNLSSQLRQRDDGQLLQFEDCFRYGTSKMNQRIEAWWWQQSRGCTGKWRDYFVELKEDNRWNPDSIADRVALLAVYIPILRNELHEFVELWNNHKIRKQPDRPHVVGGRPLMLYRCPEQYGGHRCGSEVPSELLEGVEDLTDPFDIDEYLPLDTLYVCHGILQDLDFVVPVDPRMIDENGDRVHVAAYTALRDALRRHVRTGVQPPIQEAERPLARNWQPHAATQAAFAAAGEVLEPTLDPQLEEGTGDTREDVLEAADGPINVTDERWMAEFRANLGAYTE